VRPTFGDGDRVLEVYLFDIDEDLYGERVRVELVRRQRRQRRFVRIAALRHQMDRDAARAREILARAAA
jgi:riboflavin kinase/FMN adenylyltransferase